MIRTPVRPPADPLWNGRHFFWPGCDCCCADPVYFATTLISGSPRPAWVWRLRDEDGVECDHTDASQTTSQEVQLLRCDSAGNTYAMLSAGGAGGTNWLVKVHSGGGVAWAVEGWSQCEVTPDGFVYTFSEDGVDVLKYDTDGALDSSFALAGTGATKVGQVLAVDPIDDSILVGKDVTGGHSWLQKYDSGGTLQWETDYGAVLFGTSLGALGNGELAIDSDGAIYTAHHNNRYTKHDASGVEQWAITGAGLMHSVAVNHADRVFFLDQSSELIFEVDPSDGSTLWSVSTTQSPRKLAAVGGYLYVALAYDAVSDTVARKLSDVDGSEIWGAALAFHGRGAAARPGRWPLWP